ncbi:hypothetical protein COV93_09020 [Candidatus Woesearchaeota archaeon CG11_big_fil_rev_8_21_14_0_20_43_8]|nr:MAG: hypothetical protein COV93_09020 [Candidatus Woesearchaeota archaeon CG11_big_fil_rev_8_21_14_0_20_43_8]
MKSILLVCGKWMGECATSTLLKKNKADLSGFMQELLEDKHLKDVAKYVPDYTIYALKEIMDIREIRNAI